MAGEGRTIGTAIPIGGRNNALRQKPAQSIADVERELRIESVAAGHPIPESMMIPHDGSFLRFGPSSRNAGFARLLIGDSGHHYGVAGCFKCGMRLRVPMHPERPRDIDPMARRRLAQAAEKARQRAEAERHRRGTERARRHCAAANPCTKHPYLSAKLGPNVPLPPGLLIDRYGFLIVPRRDIAGRFVGYQRISPDGMKRYSAGTPTAGTFLGLGTVDPFGTVLVAEGLATGLTVHFERGHPTAVAFDAGNLLFVCMALRERYPVVRIVLCADDDRQTAGNPGLTKAKCAASAVNGLVAPPPLCRCCRCTDYNDLAACGRRRAGVR